MATPTFTSSQPGFQVASGIGYIDLSNGNLANSPKNATIQFDKVSGGATFGPITISVRNGSLPYSQYVQATLVALATFSQKIPLTNLVYGETEIKVEATSVAAMTVDVNALCWSN